MSETNAGSARNFPKPSLTVDAVVLAGAGELMHLLVIERARPPFAGHFALPGGFVDPFEPPFQACLRELRQETGLVPPNPIALPLRLRTRKGRDPRGWTLSQPFLFHLQAPLAVTAADDARTASWLPLAELGALAFDHGAILCEALGHFWSEMPGAFPLLRDVRAFGAPQPFPAAPLFFGGSFNPLHDGHRAGAVLAAAPDRLIVVPDSNPFKDHATPSCAWQHYIALREAFANTALAIFPGYCGMELPNPTSSWLPFVPGRLSFLIGEDSLVKLPRWIEPARLVRALDRLLVLPRREHLPDLEASRDWLAATAPQCRLEYLADHPYRDLSSSALRANASAHISHEDTNHPKGSAHSLRPYHHKHAEPG